MAIFMWWSQKAGERSELFVSMALRVPNLMIRGSVLALMFLRRALLTWKAIVMSVKGISVP